VFDLVDRCREDQWAT